MVDRHHHKDLLMGLFDPNSKKPVYDPVQATELLDELRRVIPWGGLKSVPENLVELPSDIYMRLSRFLKATQLTIGGGADYLNPVNLLLKKLDIDIDIEEVNTLEDLFSILSDMNHHLMEIYFESISELLGKAFTKACKTDEDRASLLRYALQEIGFPDASVSLKAAQSNAGSSVKLPLVAPALWLARENRKETAPDFIKRVYAPWLGQGLTQAHIHQLDKQLYTALHNWLRFNDMPADLDLPTKKQLNDRLLQIRGTPSSAESLGKAISEASPEVRERIRLYDVARRRASRKERENLP
jgi:hypothetical protein